MEKHMARDEKNYIKKIGDMFENDMIKVRVIYLLNWYSKKASKYRIKYFICAFLSVVIPACITLISNILKNTYYVIPVLSTIGTITAGILAISRWQEGWLRYRKTVESIKSEISVYLVMRNYHNSLENNEKVYEVDLLFLEKIEEIVKYENNEWVSLRMNNDNKSNDVLENIKN